MAGSATQVMGTLIRSSDTEHPHIDGEHVPYIPPVRHDTCHLIYALWLEARLRRFEEVYKR